MHSGGKKEEQLWRKTATREQKTAFNKKLQRGIHRRKKAVLENHYRRTGIRGRRSL